MKVDVITLEEAKVPKFCWWSRWIDIAIFDYRGEYGYLLQMKVSRLNAKRFKCLPFNQHWWSDAHPGIEKVESLTQMEKKQK